MFNVSVIVPVYNVEKYLVQCLESLIAQTWEDLEIVCVNDGSTDSSLDILRKYEKKYANIKVIDKKNGGYGTAVNCGLEHAKGMYIGIVEPDDFIVKDMYESLYNAAKNTKYPDIIKAGYWDYFDDAEEPITKVQIGMKLKNETVFSLEEHPELLRIHPSIWSCIYKKDFLKDNSIRMVEAPGAGWVDNPFFFETLYKAKNICWVAKPVYYYRQTNINASSNLKDCSIPINRMKEVFDFYKKENIKNETLKMELYKRALLYLFKIKENPALTIENKNEAYTLVKKMDLKIVKKMKRAEIETYEFFLGRSINKNGKFKQWLRNNYSNTKVYQFFKKIYKAGKYFDEHGIYLTCKRIKQEIPHKKQLKLPPKKGLRVLFIPSDNNRTSGAFLSMVVLNKILREQHNVDTFVVLPNSGNGEELLIKNKIPYIMIESADWVEPLGTVHNQKWKDNVLQKVKKNKVAISKLEKIIKKYKVDIVHINTTYSYVGAKAALKTKTPFVWHIREFLEEDQGNTLWDREKCNELINKADRIVTISDSLYRKYLGIVDDSRLTCILNGIDAKKFYKEKKIILNNYKVRFVMIGGFEVYKGHLEFASACAELYKKGYDFEVWFIGTGKKEIRNQVEEIFAEAGMKENVVYLGYKNNVYDYLENTDISFTCSKSEAFGRTTVEAMLSGNLVIGADSAGTKELIRNNETGLLYQQGNVQDLCSKMELAITQKKYARQLANAGREYMYNNMTAEINAENILKLYREIL